MFKLEIMLQENWAVHQIAKILVLCVSLIKYQKTENSDFLAFIFRPTVSKYLYWRLRSDPNRVVLDYLKIDIHLKDLWQNAFENHWPPISSKHWIDCFSRNFIIHLHKISLWELLEWVSLIQNVVQHGLSLLHHNINMWDMGHGHMYWSGHINSQHLYHSCIFCCMRLLCHTDKHVIMPPSLVTNYPSIYYLHSLLTALCVLSYQSFLQPERYLHWWYSCTLSKGSSTIYLCPHDNDITGHCVGIIHLRWCIICHQARDFNERQTSIVLMILVDQTHCYLARLDLQIITMNRDET